jgi:hypothetical protein
MGQHLHLLAKHYYGAPNLDLEFHIHMYSGPISPLFWPQLFLFSNLGSLPSFGTSFFYLQQLRLRCHSFGTCIIVHIAHCITLLYPQIVLRCALLKNISLDLNSHVYV